MAQIKSILIIVAMEAESVPLIKHLGLTAVTAENLPSPAHFYSGTYNNTAITVATNGKCSRFGVDNVGTVPASLTAYIAITSFKPDIIINAGTSSTFTTLNNLMHTSLRIFVTRNRGGL
jgi:5'-methylthioadenosine nucleosidase